MPTCSDDLAEGKTRTDGPRPSLAEWLVRARSPKPGNKRSHYREFAIRGPLPQSTTSPSGNEPCQIPDRIQRYPSARGNAELRKGSTDYFFDFFLAFFGPRPLKVSSAMPDLSSPPNPSLVILRYWERAALASGKSSLAF